jgi:potassium-transporting ATPase KdpC subunit
MRRQLLTGLLMTIAMTVLVGLVYPFVMTGIAQVAFHDRANGSFVSENGRVVGSSLIGQNFVLKNGSPDPRYFQPRPSAAGTDGYDAMASGGTNDGPSSKTLLDNVAARVKAYRALNGLSSTTMVPVDAVTASASGLDPDISVANARLQAARVARARKLPVSQVLDLVDQHTNKRQLGILGEETVNVLDLNLALDQVR